MREKTYSELRKSFYSAAISNDNKKVISKNYVDCICIIITTYKVRKLYFTLPVEPFFPLLETEYGEIE